MGNAFKQQGDLEAAIASYNKALDIDPDFAEGYNNRGSTLKDQGKLDAAIASYQEALSLRPNYAEAHYNVANILKEKGDLTAAIASYLTAIDLKKDYAEAHWNASLAMLLAGDYINGWEEYKWRHKTERLSRPHAEPKCMRVDFDWLSSSENLLIVSEQGLGDTLQFMRYISALRGQVGSVKFCAQAKLHPLIQASGIDPSPLMPEQANMINTGAWMPLLSLPGALGGLNNPIVTAPTSERRMNCSTNGIVF